MPTDIDMCRCGHMYGAHIHYRRGDGSGSDCGPCGPDLCRYFRRDPSDRPVLGWLRRRLTRVREG